MVRTCVSMLVLTAFALVGAAAVAAQTGSPRPEAANGKPAVIVNLNTATAADLERLPGIGAKTAQRILDYRQKNGPFKKVEELMNIQGIGEKGFLKLRPQLSVTTGPASSGSPQ